MGGDQYCCAKPKGNICLLVKQADTVFRFGPQNKYVT